eukprot:jgi/Botrbrau1/22172/Bobra.168_1s0004.1
MQLFEALVHARTPLPLFATRPAPFFHSLAPAQGPRLYQCRRKSAGAERLPTTRDARRTPLCPSELREAPALPWQPKYDVLGLGQAMVDLSCTVDDPRLAELGVSKSERRIISLEERVQIMEVLGQGPLQVSAGGSLANTLVGLARLGSSWHSQYGLGPMRVGFWSVCGKDPQGVFHSAQMQGAGVEVLSQPGADTGTVIVMTTPDAQRTFLSFLGSPQPLEVTPKLEAELRSTRVLLIEGYMLEMPNAADALLTAIRIAKEAGAFVALTAGDAGLVGRHQQAIWDLLEAGVDMLFANRCEAAALLGKDVSAKEAARELGPHLSMAVVTDGANGSWLSALGNLYVIPPHWMAKPPMDTCGAGDAYAAGLLFGYLSGQGITTMGRTAARAASAVISRSGASMSPEQASEIVRAIVPFVYLEAAAQAADAALPGSHS